MSAILDGQVSQEGFEVKSVISNKKIIMGQSWHVISRSLPTKQPEFCKYNLIQFQTMRTRDGKVFLSSVALACGDQPCKIEFFHMMFCGFAACNIYLHILPSSVWGLGTMHLEGIYIT